MSEATPQKIERVGDDRLAINWNDGQRRVYTLRELLDNCPCASCREKRNAPTPESQGLLPVLSPEEARPLRIVDMKSVGNYAYGITFSDGHDTGIYTLEFLRQIGA